MFYCVDSQDTYVYIYNTIAVLLQILSCIMFVILQVCTLTTGTPGDGVDNDCDGLIDEEQCSDSITPGTVGMYTRF